MDKYEIIIFSRSGNSTAALLPPCGGLLGKGGLYLRARCDLRIAVGG